MFKVLLTNIFLNVTYTRTFAKQISNIILYNCHRYFFLLYNNFKNIAQKNFSKMKNLRLKYNIKYQFLIWYWLFFW